MFKKKIQNNRGFTLVEMMVSVAIFSIVVMIALGAVLTILDANRKARTLTEVMNNLNFSVEMITRSFKTGVEPRYDSENKILYVSAIVLNEAGFNRETTRYRLSEVIDPNDTSNKIGTIEQCVSSDEGVVLDNRAQCPVGGLWTPITSDLVDIDSFNVAVDPPDGANFVQPRTQIVISGTAKVNEKISSGFSLQTSVSQRRLNIAGSELD